MFRLKRFVTLTALLSMIIPLLAPVTSARQMSNVTSPQDAAVFHSHGDDKVAKYESAQGAQAPWGIASVTTAQLTPEMFVTALPEEFGDSHLQDIDTRRNDDPYFPEAHVTNLLGYFDQADEISLLVSVSHLSREISVADALLGLEDTLAADPEITVEESNISSQGEVRFLMARELGNYFLLSWGAENGRSVFTVMATGESDREVFVRELVSTLQRSGSPQDANESSAATDAWSRQTMDDAVLLELLLETPFSDQVLPPGFSGATGSKTTPAHADIGTQVSFDFAYGPPLRHGITYWLFPTAADAERFYLSHSMGLQSALGAVEIPITVAGYPGLGLSSNDSSTVMVLIENVVVIGNAVGLRPNDVVGVEAYAFALAEAGVLHLERVMNE